MNEPKRSERKDMHTISILVANKPGVLVRVALVFARRAYNIDSLVVSPTVNPHYSRMTITAQGNPEALEQIIKQASKLIDVLHASEHTYENKVEKELALYKVHANPAARAAIIKLLKKFHAHIDDSSEGALIIEQTGTTAQLDELEELLKKYGIVEMVRTGKILMMKGKAET